MANRPIELGRVCRGLAGSILCTSDFASGLTLGNDDVKHRDRKCPASHDVVIKPFSNLRGTISVSLQT